MLFSNLCSPTAIRIQLCDLLWISRSRLSRCRYRRNRLVLVGFWGGILLRLVGWGSRRRGGIGVFHGRGNSRVEIIRSRLGGFGGRVVQIRGRDLRRTIRYRTILIWDSAVHCLINFTSTPLPSNFISNFWVPCQYSSKKFIPYG